MTTDLTLPHRLLDAQVAWVMAELSDDRLRAMIERDVDDVLDVAATVRLDALISAEDVCRIITTMTTDVPASTTVSTMVQTWTAVVHEGPSDPISMADVVSRDHAEALLQAILALHPVVEQALERLADSPMAGNLASRFVSRIVGDVLQMNRSVAEKIPGVGSMMSLGTSAASKVMGAADKPLQMMGDPANRGAAFAVRRLNKVVIDTLRDPLLLGALMEVWDQNADEPLQDAGRVVPLEDVQHVAGLVQDILIAAAPSAPVQAAIAAFVEAFFDIYGEHPPTVLLQELEITRTDIVAELQTLLPRAVEAARASGRLEAAVRERLEPFFLSPAVADLLTS